MAEAFSLLLKYFVVGQILSPKVHTALQDHLLCLKISLKRTVDNWVEPYLYNQLMNDLRIMQKDKTTSKIKLGSLADILKDSFDDVSELVGKFPELSVKDMEGTV